MQKSILQFKITNMKTPLTSLFLLFSIINLYSQVSTNNTSEENRKKPSELIKILTSYTGNWKPMEENGDPYFIKIVIYNEQIVWETTKETEDNQLMLNSCVNDSIITTFTYNEITLTDTTTLSIESDEIKTKAYKNIIFPTQDSICTNKAYLLYFESKCFWEENMKTNMIFYCENKLLLILKDSKEEFQFWFKKQ